MKKRTNKRKLKFNFKKIGSYFKENPSVIIVFIMSIVLFLLVNYLLGSRLGTSKILLGFIALNLIYMIPSIIRAIKGKKKTKAERKKFAKRFLIGIVSCFIVGMIAVSAFIFMVVNKAPEFDPEKLYTSESTILYAKDGSIFKKIGTERREKISYNDMSEVLIDAIVATEDARFFQHNGFDLPRFLIASVKQLLGNSDAGGASTLTMQVVKNTWTSAEDEGWTGIVRKFTDIYMSMFKVEKKYTKEEIIEFYANFNYLGSSSWGVEQASLTYFGKSAKDLTLPEAALIAGLFNAPNALDPYRNPEGAEKRRQTVLYLMNRHGYINDKEWEIAKNITVEDMLIEHEPASDYQGFIDTVVDEVMDKTGLNPYVVPMEIYTTLDAEKQDYLNKVMSGEIYKWENDVVQAGVVVLDTQTGGLAAVGNGRNRTGLLEFNFATDIENHIGSTSKPLFDYGPYIEYENGSTYSLFADEEHAYSDGVKFVNWDRKYMGLLTLRDSLRMSRNIPAVKAFQYNSNKNIQKFVQGLGLSPELSGGLMHEAHALGGYNGESPMSLAGAYAAFGNGGYYNKPYSVTKIVYRDTNETWEYKSQKTKAMSEETAYMIFDILKQSAQYGLGGWANVNGAELGAKTGTSNHDKATIDAHPNWPNDPVNDSWIAGVNSQYTITLWYGYEHIMDDYVNRMSSYNHLRLYNQIAKGMLSSGNRVSKPSGVVSSQVEFGTNPPMLPSENTPKDLIVTELFKKGTEPTEVSPRFQNLENTNKASTSYNNGKITIAWDPIEMPDSINKTKIEELAASVFKSEKGKNNFVNERINYNNANIGEVGYNVYVKNADGSLTLVGFTKDKTISYTPNSTAENVTFVIKSTYSIFKNAESNGFDIVHKFNGTEESIISSNLKGDKIINLKINDPYTEISVLVLENGIDVTSKATITTSITRKSDNKIVSKVTTDVAEEYIIKYDVKYKTHTKTYTRTVIIT